MQLDRKGGKRGIDAELRRTIRYDAAKRADKFAGDLPDFRTMKPGDVIEIVRVPHGATPPDGFAHLPPGKPSHHDRFSTKAARRVTR